MTKNRLIHLSDGEKCWLVIGICFGIILTMVSLYLYTYLPSITEVQKVGLTCFVGGGALVYVLGKISWEDME